MAMVATATHRTDVEYVGPQFILRPPPEQVSLVYLDQNHWINLAKAAVGHPGGAPYQVALDALREARAADRIVVPLSLTHIMETVSNQNRRQRGDLATVMEELSGFLALLPRDVVMKAELEAVLDVVGRPRPTAYVPVPLIGLGTPFAYGRRGRFYARRGDEDMTEELRRENPELAAEMEQRFREAERDLDRAILRRPIDDAEEARLRGHGWQPSTAQAIAEDRAQQEREQADRLSDATLVAGDKTRWRKDRLRDVTRGRYVVVELMDMLQEGLGVRGLEIEDVWSDVDSSRRLVDAMPSADVCVSLMTEYHRNPHTAWKPNDIFDIDALSIAVAYCDVVVTDKKACHELHVSDVPDRLETPVFWKLDDLVAWLAT